MLHSHARLRVRIARSQAYQLLIAYPVLEAQKQTTLNLFGGLAPKLLRMVPRTIGANLPLSWNVRFALHTQTYRLFFVVHSPVTRRVFVGCPPQLERFASLATLAHGWCPTSLDERDAKRGICCDVSCKTHGGLNGTRGNGRR